MLLSLPLHGTTHGSSSEAYDGRQTAYNVLGMMGLHLSSASQETSCKFPVPPVTQLGMPRSVPPIGWSVMEWSIVCSLSL